MRDSTHSRQIYTLFGGAYVPEEHATSPALGELGKRSKGKWAVVLAALLIGATTAASAMKVTSQTNLTPPHWLNQKPANFQMKIPGSFWFEDVVY